MIVAVMFVGFVAVAQTTEAACSITTTLRVGSKGAEVSCLQNALGGVSVDGNFGPMTKTAVMAWQASHGLTADGVFGAMSRAAWMSTSSSNTGTYPAGCTSNTGYSTTTGASCAVSSTLPAGCMSTAGYSSTTGAKCDGATTGSTGPLTGGAGDITLGALSVYSGEEVGEGDEDVAVMGFDVEADEGSDVEISSVKVEFFQDTGADSDKLSDYASEVSIWLNGKMVGSSDVEDFSESNDYHSKSISLTGAVVKAGDTEDFVVAVTALDNLDSGDIDTDDWSADLLSVRFEDADGVVTTESGSASGTDGAGAFEKNFDFGTFATANSVDMKVALNDDEEDVNQAHVIDIDTDQDTDDVKVLAFTIEADGDSDLNISEIPATITTTGEVDEAVLVSNAQLWHKGVSIATDTIPTGGAIVFEDLDIDVKSGDTEEFYITVDIQDTDGVADNGDTVKAELTTVNVDAIEAEDETGEEVVDGDASGSAVGDAHAVFDAGIMVEFVSATAERTFAGDAAGEDDQGTYIITFDVTSFDGIAYLDRHVADQDTIGDAGEGVEYNVTSTAGTPAASSALLDSNTTDTNDTTDVFQVEEDDTRRFTVTVILTADTTPTDGSHQVILESIGWGTVTTDATNDNNYTFNLGDFKTPSLFLNAQ